MFNSHSHSVRSTYFHVEIYNNPSNVIEMFKKAKQNKALLSQITVDLQRITKEEHWSPLNVMARHAEPVLDALLDLAKDKDAEDLRQAIARSLLVKNQEGWPAFHMAARHAPGSLNRLVELADDKAIAHSIAAALIEQQPNGNSGLLTMLLNAEANQLDALMSLVLKNQRVMQSFIKALFIKNTGGVSAFERYLVDARHAVLTQLICAEQFNITDFIDQLLAYDAEKIVPFYKIEAIQARFIATLPEHTNNGWPLVSILAAKNQLEIIYDATSANNKELLIAALTLAWPKKNPEGWNGLHLMIRYSTPFFKRLLNAPICCPDIKRAISKLLFTRVCDRSALYLIATCDASQLKTCFEWLMQDANYIELKTEVRAFINHFLVDHNELAIRSSFLNQLGELLSIQSPQRRDTYLHLLVIKSPEGLKDLFELLEQHQYDWSQLQKIMGLENDQGQSVFDLIVEHCPAKLESIFNDSDGNTVLHRLAQTDVTRLEALIKQAANNKSLKKELIQTFFKRNRTGDSFADILFKTNESPQRIFKPIVEFVYQESGLIKAFYEKMLTSTETSTHAPLIALIFNQHADSFKSILETPLKTEELRACMGNQFAKMLAPNNFRQQSVLAAMLSRPEVMDKLLVLAQKNDAICHKIFNGLDELGSTGRCVFDMLLEQHKEKMIPLILNANQHVVMTLMKPEKDKYALIVYIFQYFSERDLDRFLTHSEFKKQIDAALAKNSNQYKSMIYSVLLGCAKSKTIRQKLIESDRLKDSLQNLSREAFANIVIDILGVTTLKKNERFTLLGLVIRQVPEILTPLLLRAKDDLKIREEIAQALLVQDDQKSTPLHLWCKKDPERLSDLLSFAKDYPEIRDVITKGLLVAANDGWTLLHIVCSESPARLSHFSPFTTEDYPEMTDAIAKALLLQKKAGFTPLHMWCRYESGKLRDLVLFAKNASKIRDAMAQGILLTQAEGWTPLHSWCQKEPGQLCDLLLVAKDYPNIFNAIVKALCFQTKDGWTPLHILCRYAPVHFRDLLLFAKEYIETRDAIFEAIIKASSLSNQDGYTPLHLLCLNAPKQFPEFLSFAKDYSMFYTAIAPALFSSNKEGWTPLKIFQCEEPALYSEMFDKKSHRVNGFFPASSQEDSMNKISEHKKTGP